MDRKTIFITGAASGIGRATAQRFASEGWWVGAADLNAAGLETLQAELGPDNCASFVLDVTDKAAYDRVVAKLAQVTDGKLDMLYNNAGIGVTGYFDDIPLEQAMQLVQVNLVGVINGVYAALPLLKNSSNSLCFSTSSSAATYGAPHLAVYAATKFAVKGLTEALAVELSRFNVRAADVLPGLIDTAILTDSPLYVDGERVEVQGRTVGVNPSEDGPFRLISPSEVAAAAWLAYQNDTIHWYVPAEIEEIDKLKVQSPEALRDQRIEMMFGDG